MHLLVLLLNACLRDVFATKVHIGMSPGQTGYTAVLLLTLRVQTLVGMRRMPDYFHTKPQVKCGKEAVALP